MSALKVSARAGCANLVSDNVAGAAPEVVAAVLAANKPATAPAYGNDDLTISLEPLLSAIFETRCLVVPVATGTGCNALALSLCASSALAKCGATPAVLCHAGSHIYVDENGAVEAAGQLKLLPIAGEDAKLTAEALAEAAGSATRYGDYGGVPVAASVTQVNEAGLCYTLHELEQLGRAAERLGLLLHMDGARFANALEGLGCSPAEMTWHRGVDALSFGGTKNGCFAAEAVVIFTDTPKMRSAPFAALAAKWRAAGGGPSDALRDEARLRLKRAGSMFSKMRFLSAQLHGYLGPAAANSYAAAGAAAGGGGGAPWRRYARSANSCAARLAAGVEQIGAQIGGGGEAVALLQPVQSNEVFLTLPAAVLDGVIADGHACLDIGSLAAPPLRRGELLRCVTCWATTEPEIDRFLSSVRRHALGASASGAAAKL